MIEHSSECIECEEQSDYHNRQEGHFVALFTVELFQKLCCLSGFCPQTSDTVCNDKVCHLLNLSSILWGLQNLRERRRIDEEISRYFESASICFIKHLNEIEVFEKCYSERLSVIFNLVFVIQPKKIHLLIFKFRKEISGGLTACLGSNLRHIFVDLL